MTRGLGAGDGVPESDIEGIPGTALEFGASAGAREGRGAAEGPSPGAGAGLPSRRGSEGWGAAAKYEDLKHILH